MLRVDDTIVAIATPPGRGGIGVIRLSGAQAPQIASALIGRPLGEPRRASLARVALGNGSDTLHDQVVVTWFAAPHSYTGEHVVELSAHGSPVILRGIVERAAALGARLAEPGEFTMRAYLRGRMDLAQAEAVADLAAASTTLEARSASEQLHGSLSGAIRSLHEQLFDLIARLEASLDFPDEGYHFIEADELRHAVLALRERVLQLAAAGRRGRLLREGAVVALAGRPNTGKSSLFNRLVGFNRAIVTASPGTTRDVLTETINLAGVRTTLVDTAGVRETADPIEAEGVRRAVAAAESATLTVLVLDRSEVLGDEDRALLGRMSDALVAANKSDLPAAWRCDEVPGAIAVSAKTGEGVQALTDAISDRLGIASLSRELPVVTNMRHVLLLEEAGAALERAARAVAEEQRMPEEFVLADLHDARHALERVVGAHDPDDLLNHIFARFCIGK
ncbi:MAG TPA: tRNA uridine-5-carboxymethylaminomethyl(34) synthesis GTPase MnmE [Vicinamibacterales bacterium]